MENYCIYKITSPSGRVYIGQSKNVKKRIRDYKNCKPSQKVLYRSLKKYGYKNHIFEIIIQGLSKEEVNLKEIELIKFYKDLNISLNISDGGYTDSNARKRKIVKLSLKGEYIAEYAGISEAAREHNIGISSLCYAVKRGSNYSGGFLWVYKEEYDEEKSISWKQRFFVEKNQPVYKFNLDGVLIDSYNSIYEAADKNNTSIAILNKNIKKNKIKSSDHKGFMFSTEKILSSYEHPNSKKILQYDMEGNFLREFISLREASKELSISKSTILNKLKQDPKIKPKFSFIFKYKKND